MLPQKNKDFHRSTENKLVILLYHGVTKFENNGICNKQGKHISEKEFREHMLFIKQHCTPLSIDDWLSLRNGNNMPKNPVIVSFDDGFENNFTTACPVLEEFKIPAIFYISSGMIGTHKMFWVDIIEDLINRTEAKRISLKLERIDEFDLLGEDNKFKTLLKIKSFCKAKPNNIKNKVISDLQIATNVEPSCFANPNYKSMSWDQLIKLANNPLFTIGGHSLNHNILSSLSNKDLESEVIQSLEMLEDKLGHPINHYSYPEGQPIHFNEKVIEVLKNNGIVCSPSAIYGVNNHLDDLFNLKRIMVGFDGVSFPYLI